MTRELNRWRAASKQRMAAQAKHAATLPPTVETERAERLKSLLASEAILATMGNHAATTLRAVRAEIAKLQETPQ